jgi:hypothetical protein
VIEFADGHAAIKRYLARRGGEIHCGQWNEDEPDFDPSALVYPATTVRGLHAVIANLR